MANRPKRAFMMRAAVGLAALASPLLATGAAQAAIAGAQPQKASQVPALASATIDPSTANAVDVCFDKAVLPGTAQNDFSLVGYRANQTYDSSSVASLNGNCVKVSFAVAKLTPFTVLTANDGAVTSAGGSNNTDSTPLIGSTSHSGTRNVASGPNLAGVSASTSSSAGNQYIFTFDKDVTAPSNSQASSFYIVGADGRETDGQSVTPVASNAVAVTFAVADSNGQSTANAFLGGVRQYGVESQYDSSYNVNESSQIPYASNAPSEFAPYLVSAALNGENASSATTNPGGESVTYTFSQGVNPAGSTTPASGSGQPFASDFKLQLANGTVLTADSVTAQSTTGPTTTVTANFTSSANTYKSEFGVVAFADTGAVSTYSATAPASGIPSAASSAAVGGNPGAFGEGFTTAPDVTGIAIAHNVSGGTADVLTINLDDRTSSTSQSTSGFTYYDATGASVASPLGACSVAQGGTTLTTGTPAPSPETVTCAYAPNALNNVASVGFAGDTFVGTLNSNGDQYSIPQIDSPIASSAIARAYRINVAHMKTKKHSKKHTKKHSKKHTKKH